MIIKRFNNTKEEKIREAVGLPNDDIFSTPNIVCTDTPTCENTISVPPVKKKNGIQDFTASGGSISSNTEVNAENQGIKSETTSFYFDRTKRK
jgi:hypothetical protein